MIQETQDEGFRNIVGLVIVGLPQGDADSKLITQTLHPCLACRKFLRSRPGITPHTIIVTVDLYADMCQIMTVDQLLRYHAIR